MQVKDIMTRNAEYVEPEMTLKKAAEKMKTMDVGALPIGENDRLIGMITDRDITVRAIAEGADPVENKVRNFMTEGIVYCYENQTVEEASDIMKDKKIRRLVVLNDDKRMVGFCSLGDLAIGTEGHEVKGETLSEVSKSGETGKN